MSRSKDGRIPEAEIARVAREIWEAEGRPSGRDQEHWLRAREILEAERDGTEARAPRPVQPGFTDAAPGTVPDMKPTLAPGELREDAGGRFAKQLSEAPEAPSPEPGPDARTRRDTARPPAEKE